LRPIPNPMELNPVAHAEMGNAIEKILGFNKGRPKSKRTLIENALPFCCYHPKKVKQAALGAIREDGHSSLFIDAGMQIKPSYFLDMALGSALNDSVLSAWKHGFMKRLHALEFIAERCHACSYVLDCMAGSRFSALLVNGSLYDLDPLALPEKFL